MKEVLVVNSLKIFLSLINSFVPNSYMAFGIIQKLLNAKLLNIKIL